MRLVKTCYFITFFARRYRTKLNGTHAGFVCLVAMRTKTACCEAAVVASLRVCAKFVLSSFVAGSSSVISHGWKQ